MALSRRSLLAGAPILFSVAAGASPQKTPTAPGKAEFDALQRKYRTRQQALIEPLRKETDRDKLMTRYRAVQATLYKEFAPAFQALAKKHKGTSVQIRATLEAADLCEGTQKKDEADRLLGSLVRECLNLPEPVRQQVEAGEVRQAGSTGARCGRDITHATTGALLMRHRQLHREIAQSPGDPRQAAADKGNREEQRRVDGRSRGR